MMKGKKKSHGVQLLIRSVVRDRDGKVLLDTGQKPSKSYLIQFLEFMYALFKDDDNLAATDIAGAETNIYIKTQSVSVHSRVRAPAGVEIYGIMVGTGDTAVTNTDYKLETRLTEGIGLGNITHGEGVVGNAAVVGANVDLEAYRSFPNNTGASITIKEVGIYTLAFANTHCILRDVLDTPVVLPDKCTFTVYYTFRTTV